MRTATPTYDYSADEEALSKRLRPRGRVAARDRQDALRGPLRRRDHHPDLGCQHGAGGSRGERPQRSRQPLRGGRAGLRRRGWRPRRAASGSTPCTASPTPAENVTALPLAATVLSKLGDALSFSFGMFWEILWALILGFGISAMVQAVISKREMRRLLPDDAPRSIALAAGLGAASSSCSYAAVALARSLFRKGADFTAAMAFEFASTNLVIELGIVVALLLGWQFTLAEFVGGPLMIVILAVLFRLFLRDRLLRSARDQADRGLAGSMEGHAAMDMSIARP